MAIAARNEPSCRSGIGQAVPRSVALFVMASALLAGFLLTDQAHAVRAPRGATDPASFTCCAAWRCSRC